MKHFKSRNEKLKLKADVSQNENKLKVTRRFKIINSRCTWSNCTEEWPKIDTFKLIHSKMLTLLS